jgi:hypothetical protein
MGFKHCHLFFVTRHIFVLIMYWKDDGNGHYCNLKYVMRTNIDHYYCLFIDWQYMQSSHGRWSCQMFSQSFWILQFGLLQKLHMFQWNFLLQDVSYLSLTCFKTCIANTQPWIIKLMCAQSHISLSYDKHHIFLTHNTQPLVLTCKC